VASELEPQEISALAGAFATWQAHFMRLSGQDVAQIKQVVAAVDPSCEVYLFGSRTDDEARGGDIDLLLLSDVIDLTARLEIRIKLRELLGDQRIDLIVAGRDPALASVFVREAMRRGSKL
jgi:predicted nucleotidyltransferase